MKTKLEELLQTIDPKKTLDDVAARVDKALNSFRMGSGLIDDWDEFKAVMARFFSHVESVVLGIKPSRTTDPDMDWGRCCRIHMKEYGHSGDKAAFEIVRTGSEGGVYAVLKLVAKRMTEEYAQREISARIGIFYARLSLEKKLAVCDEYLSKYGHLLPYELTEGSAARIKANFPEVLEEHPRLIRRLSSIGRA